MSPLMTIVLVMLVPFPLLALMLLVDRWMKWGNDTVSPELSDH